MANQWHYGRWKGLVEHKGVDALAQLFTLNRTRLNDL
jgi:hypothetical protein